MIERDAFHNVIGTIIRVNASPENPAERPEESRLYYAGYDEITVISTGANKHFPAGCWKIRLVTYKDRVQHPTKTGKNCTFIAVDPDNMILRIETGVGDVPGALGPQPFIKISMYSAYTKDREEILLCTPDMVQAEPA